MGYIFILYTRILIPSLTFKCNNEVILSIGQQNTNFGTWAM